MRSTITLAALGALVLGSMPVAAIGGQRQTRSRSAGLCRRTPTLAPLAPEARPARQPRWERRDGVPLPPPPAVDGPAAADVVVTGSVRSETPPPPPPPPPPAPPAPSSAGGDIALTGSRTPAPPVVSTPSPRGGPRPQAGLLTAGEHDDLLNPELYRRYVDGFLATETLDGVPRVDTARVLTVAVTDRAGRPMPFAPVTLTCADGNRLTLATVADGTATFFPTLDRLGRAVSIDAGAGAARWVALTGAGGQRQSFTLDRTAAAVRRLDLALVIDTTGSMTDELDYLKAELGAIVGRLRARHPGLDMRVGLVAYRDEGDEYVTRTFALTPDLAQLRADLGRQRADGGGDYPEAVEQAMARAVALDWRPDAVRSLLLVADAPPHADDVAATWRAAEAARCRRIQIVPVAASGVAEGAEYLMRAVAAVTQSRYLFLTDDSGIGDPHAPPAIDCYLVTRLDHAIERVLAAQVSGRRVEPARGEVIRTVGTYDNGRCVLPPGTAD